MAPALFIVHPQNLGGLRDGARLSDHIQHFGFALAENELALRIFNPSFCFYPHSFAFLLLKAAQLTIFHVYGVLLKRRAHGIKPNSAASYGAGVAAKNPPFLIQKRI